ncbi:non-ribosomal peptide synthetase [Kamptonema sp. UHCC 0994]|uniref:non-ribosomal peptide synthetase family protein n=1 Tax=Kamptonema sp. UHCC 0994 TaxID=3031329 RepID=UPI0023B980B6|nr:non-ribosomal peptide synthetase [Kamptonema sp. UHCC 0994]MDF0552701.1 amino acid adenylation domain-containing protein [Kamptonema sp. UHCC 0994]
MQNQIVEGFRISPQQKRLLLLQKESCAYRAQSAILLEGSLNIAVLKTALEKVVNLHEIFRTIFHKRPGIKIPLQVVTECINVSWQEVNLNHLSSNEQSTRIEELFQEERHFIFNFDTGSLLRLTLICLSANKHILLVTLPSLCADSWTLKNLFQQIGNAYANCLEGKELFEEPIQYVQFSEWQNELLEGEDAELGKDYWSQQDISNFPPLTVPFESKLNAQIIFEPNVFGLKIERDVVANIEAIANLHNTTISEFLLACWQTLIWRLTKQSDIIIGTVCNGRKYEELHEMLGLLAKFLPVRCSFEQDFKFSKILGKISETIGNNCKWQEYFVGEEEKEKTFSDVNFPISFEFEECANKYKAGGIVFSLYKQYACFEPFKVKLTCLQREQFTIAEFYYNANLFSIADIKRLAEHFQTLVESAVSNPEAKVSELEILSPKNRHQLLVEFNNTRTNYPQDKCIHQLFEEQVQQTPDKIAVVFEDQKLTYAELNARANKLAHYLQKLGVVPEMLVGIYAERSLDIIIALLGIIKSGGAYLPIDPALPAESLASRLEDAQISILLTQHSLVKILQNCPAKVVCLDADWEIINRESNTSPASKVKCENLVYLLFTSGSTGTPKGVAVEHRQLLNYLYGILDRLDLRIANSFATVSTFAADLGNTVIFPALCTGGCLHIISQERASDPVALADYFNRHPIDCLKIVPSHLAALLASSPTQSILPHTHLILGGEATTWDLIKTIHQQAPNCRIFNHYGPTETTVGVLTYLVKSSASLSKTVPLGKPLPNTQIYVLDEQLQPVPIGVPGELYIGGAGLTRGYLNRLEEQAERFINNPFISGTKLYKTGDLACYLPDGNIEFLGRTDNQVKIRGFRIEMGEIETLLSQHPGVWQSTVSVWEKEPGNKRLIAYVVPSKKAALDAKELRFFLKEKLPEYMLPSAFIMLKSLPLTPNGKVDRQSLPTPDRSRPELEAIYVAARTPVEEKLAEIWRKVLNLEQVGIHDNFFELGGHSLLITQLLALVRGTFQVDLPLRSLFEKPTIAGLAESIDTSLVTKISPVKIGVETFDLNAEACLDPEINPNAATYDLSISEKAIFLTGATGFLGAFLLDELLQKTEANIYCLVRSPNLYSGKKKLQNSLASYLLWNEYFNSRIIPVLGDLSMPLLGLSEEEFGSLASKIDAIYHNGALVNFTYPYAALKAANVLGTQEVLRLASQIKLKPVHFISTIGVVGSTTGVIESVDSSEVKVIKEQDSLPSADALSSGYTQSKWVAEKLVTIARDRGFPITIYRPGRISGDSKTGVCNPDDHTFRTIRGCIQLKSVPDRNSMVNLIPVDYTSQAIVHLSRQKESLGKVFHLVNSHPAHWSEIINWIHSFGYPLEPIPYDIWRAKLLDAAGRSQENALTPLVPIFTQSASGNTNQTESPKPISNLAAQHFDCENTLTGLAGTSIACPPVDRQLFSTYFSYLIRSGFLDRDLLGKVQ